MLLVGSAGCSDDDGRVPVDAEVADRSTDAERDAPMSDTMSVEDADPADAAFGDAGPCVESGEDCREVPCCDDQQCVVRMISGFPEVFSCEPRT